MLRALAAGSPHSGSRRMALACWVSTSLTTILNSSMFASVISAPFSFANDFLSDPRWSMAAAATTPRGLETFFIPESFPGVSFIRFLLLRQKHMRAERLAKAPFYSRMCVARFPICSFQIYKFKACHPERGRMPESKDLKNLSFAMPHQGILSQATQPLTLLLNSGAHAILNSGSHQANQPAA